MNRTLPVALLTPSERAPTVRRPALHQVLLAAHGGLLYLFLYAPIAILVLYSFNDSTFGAGWEGFTLRWYADLLADRRLVQAFTNSLIVAGVCTVIATILGTTAALALERYPFPGRRPYEALLYLPIVSPEIVVAVALLAFFAFGLDALNSWLGTQLRLGLATVTIAHVVFNFSFVVVLVRASLSGLDRRLEEAAQDLGASPLQVFRHITLPLILPGILGGALLTFTLSLDNFILSFFTTGPGGALLPVEVYSRIKRAVTPTINAASTVMLLLSMLLVLASHVMQRRGTRR